MNSSSTVRNVRLRFSPIRNTSKPSWLQRVACNENGQRPVFFKFSGFTAHLMRPSLSRLKETGTSIQLPGFPFIASRVFSPWLFTFVSDPTRQVKRSNSSHSQSCLNHKALPRRRRQDRSTFACAAGHTCSRPQLFSPRCRSAQTHWCCNYQDISQSYPTSKALATGNGRPDHVFSRLSIGPTKPLYYSEYPLLGGTFLELDQQDSDNVKRNTRSPATTIRRQKAGNSANAAQNIPTGGGRAEQKANQSMLFTRSDTYDRDDARTGNLMHREPHNLKRRRWRNLDLRDWKKAFRTLKRDSTNGHNKHNKDLEGILPPHLLRHGDALFLMTVAEMKIFWRKLRQESNLPSRHRHLYQEWQALMLQLLYQSTTAALRFLVATTSTSRVPADCILDALDYIAKGISMKGQDGQDTPKQREKLFLFREAFGLIVAQHTPIARRIFSLEKHSHILETLAGYFQIHEIKSALQLQDSTIVLHRDMYIWLSHAFARQGNVLDALELLRKTMDTDAHPTYQPVINAARTILLYAQKGDSHHIDISSIVSELLELGIEMETGLYNVLLSNSVRRRDFDTAMRIYHIMQENNVNPDEYTFSILIHVCDKTENINCFWQIVEQLDPAFQEHVGPVVMTQLLWCWYLFGDRKSHDEVLQMYSRHYDITPFIQLGIVPEDYEPPILRETSRIRRKPTEELLFVTLSICLAASRHQFGRLAMIYDNFRRLLLAKDPLISTLGNKPHIFNVFLKAFGSELLIDDTWIRIIADMVTPLNADRSDGQPMKTPHPDKHTWNILINAFARSSRLLVVEELYNALCRRGLSCDPVTWNSLLSGYTRAQDLRKSAGVLQNFEIQNWPVDEHTVKALQPIRDRRGLIDLLQNGKVSSAVDSKTSDTFCSPCDEGHQRRAVASIEEVLDRAF